MKNLLKKVKMPGSKSKQKNKNSNNADSNSETNSKEDSKDGACSSTKEEDVSKPENPETSKNIKEIASGSNKNDIKSKDLNTIKDLTLTDPGNCEENILVPVSNVESKDETAIEMNSVAHPEGTSDSPKIESAPIESNESVIKDSDNVKSVPTTQSLDQEGAAILETSSKTTVADKTKSLTKLLNEASVSNEEPSALSRSNIDIR